MRVEEVACPHAYAPVGMPEVKVPNATVLGSFGCGPGALLEWADEECLGGLQFLAQALSTSVCTATDEPPGGLSEAM